MVATLYTHPPDIHAGSSIKSSLTSCRGLCRTHSLRPRVALDKNACHIYCYACVPALYAITANAMVGIDSG